MERRDIKQDHPDYASIQKSALNVMREKGWIYTEALAYVKDDYILQKTGPKTEQEKFFFEQLTWGKELLEREPHKDTVTYNISYAMETIDVARLKDIAVLVFPTRDWQATWPTEDGIFVNLVSFKKESHDKTPTL